MTPPVSNQLQGSIQRQLAENLIRNTQVCINLGGTIITITEDKVRLAVHTHLSCMQLKYSWIAPLGILLTLGLALATAEFKNALLPAATWKAFYLIVGLIAFAWLAWAVLRAARAPSVEDFVNLLRASQVPFATEPIEQDLVSILTSSEWILYFNPPTGMKSITFKRDGLVGIGRNINESSWRMVGDNLELLNKDGRVFSRFKYHHAQKRWIHTNDPDTLSIRGQYLTSSRPLGPC